MAKAVPSEKKHVTVWLDLGSGVSHGQEDLFRCFKCGFPIAEYTNDVVSIIPGHTPYQPNTVHKCPGTVKPKNLADHVEICQACNGRGYFATSNHQFEECGMFYSFASSVRTRNTELA